MDGGQNATASLDAGEATIPAKVRRPVKAVSLSGLTPAFAAVDPPAFEWVDPAELLVDEARSRSSRCAVGQESPSSRLCRPMACFALVKPWR
jgi:hypothetical protein